MERFAIESESLVLRELATADIPACAEAFCQAYNNDIWQNHWQTETATGYLADICGMPGFFGYVCERDGQVLGAILAREKVWWNAKEVYVEELFVSPKYQGGGVGSALLEQVEKLCREKGLAGVTLSTNRHAPAAGFYHSRGYRCNESVIFLYKVE